MAGGATRRAAGSAREEAHAALSSNGALAQGEEAKSAARAGQGPWLGSTMRWECLELSRSGADCRVPRGGTQVQSEELGRTSLKSHPGSVAVYAPWAMCTSGWDFPSFPQSRIFDSEEKKEKGIKGQKGLRKGKV